MIPKRISQRILAQDNQFQTIDIKLLKNLMVKQQELFKVQRKKLIEDLQLTLHQNLYKHQVHSLVMSEVQFNLLLKEVSHLL